MAHQKNQRRINLFLLSNGICSMLGTMGDACRISRQFQTETVPEIHLADLREGLLTTPS